MVMSLRKTFIHIVTSPKVDIHCHQSEGRLTVISLKGDIGTKLLMAVNKVYFPKCFFFFFSPNMEGIYI